MDAEDEVRVLAHGEITAAALPQIRADATDFAQSAGLDVDRAEQFALAVHEVATNTVDHAGGTGEFTVVQDDSLSLYARVADRGPGLAEPPVDERPPADAERGRGLWMSRELTDQMRIDSHDAGTVVELEMFLSETRTARPRPPTNSCSRTRATTARCFDRSRRSAAQRCVAGDTAEERSTTSAPRWRAPA